MWLTVEHITRFCYDAPVTEAYTELRLEPTHRYGQRCSSFSLVPEPRRETFAEYVDRFGNTVHHFDVLEQHDGVAVTARSEVWTAPRFVDPTTPLPLDRFDFLAPSLRAARRRPRRACRVGPGLGCAGRDGRCADARRPHGNDVRARDDDRPHDRERGSCRGAGRLSGLLPRHDRRLPLAGFRPGT